MVVQSCAKRPWVNDKEVSLFRGGNVNLDGTMKKKKKYITAEQVQVGAKANEKRRKERKEQAESLFVKRLGEDETTRS